MVLFEYNYIPNVVEMSLDVRDYIEQTMSNDISTEAEMSLDVVFRNEQKPRLKTFQIRAYPYYITCIINFFPIVVEMSLDVVEIILNKPCLTTFQPRLRCR